MGAKFGHKVSKETRKKLAEIQTGKKHSLETRNKMSLKRQGSGNAAWKGGISKGKRYTTPEYDKALHYKDGNRCMDCGKLITNTATRCNPCNHKLNEKPDSRSWQKRNVFPGIRERDGGCKICGMKSCEHKERFGYDLEVHHIDGDYTNWKDDNLLSACTPHHRMIETYMTRPASQEKLRALI